MLIDRIQLKALVKKELHPDPDNETMDSYFCKILLKALVKKEMHPDDKMMDSYFCNYSNSEQPIDDVVEDIVAIYDDDTSSENHSKYHSILQGVESVTSITSISLMCV